MALLLMVSWTEKEEKGGGQREGREDNRRTARTQLKTRVERVIGVRGRPVDGHRESLDSSCFSFPAVQPLQVHVLPRSA